VWKSNGQEVATAVCQTVCVLLRLNTRLCDIGILHSWNSHLAAAWPKSSALYPHAIFWRCTHASYSQEWQTGLSIKAELLLSYLHFNFITTSNNRQQIYIRSPVFTRHTTYSRFSNAITILNMRFSAITAVAACATAVAAAPAPSWKGKLFNKELPHRHADHYRLEGTCRPIWFHINLLYQSCPRPGHWSWWSNRWSWGKQCHNFSPIKSRTNQTSRVPPATMSLVWTATQTPSATTLLLSTSEESTSQLPLLQPTFTRPQQVRLALQGLRSPTQSLVASTPTALVAWRVPSQLVSTTTRV